MTTSQQDQREFYQNHPSKKTLCVCLHSRSSHGGNFRPPGDPKFLPMVCIDKAPGETRRYGTCPCLQMDVRGTCECGHDAKEHEGIDGLVAYETPCGGTVMGPTSFSGNIVRSMRCTCNVYRPNPQRPMEVSA